jgi:hypothetical protein
MSIFYKEGTNKLYYLIGIGIVIPALILLTYERSTILTIIFFLASVMVWISIFFEYQAIKKQRIADLEIFAKNNNYQFIVKPQSEDITEFKNFKAMQKILMPMHAHAFLNLLTPIETTDSSDINNPKIVTVSTTISAGESSSTYYTQVFLFQMESQIPIFYLAGGKHFFFSNLFRDKNIFSGIKGLQEVDIKKFDFPANRYKLYSSDKDIKSFFSKRFIELLNSGLEKKKKTLYMESDGKNIVFFVKYKRHTEEGIKFYINLFQVLIESLQIENINE